MHLNRLMVHLIDKWLFGICVLVVLIFARGLKEASFDSITELTIGLQC